MAWDEIVKDPEFQSLDDISKRKVLHGYFKENVASDPEYQSLSPEQKFKVYRGHEDDAGLSKDNSGIDNTTMPWQRPEALPLQRPQKPVSPDEPSFMRDVVGQTLKDFAGVTVKAGAGLAKGATLGAVDLEKGTVGIPFSDKKWQVQPPLDESLKDTLGVSPEIADNPNIGKGGIPYLGLGPELLGTTAPWGATSRALTTGIRYGKELLTGKDLLQAGKAAEEAVTAGGVLKRYGKGVLERTAEQGATGAIIGAAQVRDKGESMTDNALTTAAFGAGGQLVAEGVNAIAVAKGAMKYKAYNDLVDSLSNWAYGNGKFRSPEEAQKWAADTVTNEINNRGGWENVTRRQAKETKDLIDKGTKEKAAFEPESENVTPKGAALNEEDIPGSWKASETADIKPPLERPAIQRQENVDAELRAEISKRKAQPPTEPNIPGQAAAISAPDNGKPAPSPAETGLPRGVIPAAEVWDKSPFNIEQEWQKASDHINKLEDEAKPKIKQLEADYKSLKKKKDYESLKKKKFIEAEIKRLREPLSSLRSRYESRSASETEQLRLEAMQRAEAQGLTDPKELEKFSEDFISEIQTPEQVNYMRRVSDIFDSVLADYLPKGKEVTVNGEKGKQGRQLQGGQEGREVLTAAPEARQPGVEGIMEPSTEAAPAVTGEVKNQIDALAHEAATSPLSPEPHPTEAQKKAGNYKKAHISLHGLDIAIENPKGSIRSGKSMDGKEWSTVMNHHYGYIKRTEGKDGDQVDVFIGEHPESDKVFVVNQVDPKTGKFDEHKALMGFKSEDSARAGYLSNYEKGWKGLDSIAPMSMDEFKAWLKEGNTKKPIEAGKPLEEKPLSSEQMGKPAPAKTERGTKVDTRYALVEASDLITSHDTGLMRNKEYPQELQPRERERVASELQVNKIMNNLEPEFLGESPKASEGAPIVGKDMAVESGNGRTIALKKAYEEKHPSADSYKKWLIENAGRFGLESGQVSKMKNPVLVRVRQSETDRVKFVQEANEQSVAAMSATEQAKVDAANLTHDLMSVFETNESGEINTARNRDFIRSFLNKIVGSAEMGRYITSDGEISQEGIRRIRNAIFAKAYGDPTAIEKLAESTDNNIRQITNVMVAMGPKFAMIEDGIKKGDLHDLSITPEISQAAGKLSALRESGQSFTDYLNQRALFDDGITPLAKDLIGVFDFYKKSGKKLKEIFTNYIEAVERLGSPKQEALFGSFSIPTRAEVLQASIKKMEEDSVDVQNALFEDQAPYGAEGSSASEKRQAEKDSGNKEVNPSKTADTFFSQMQRVLDRKLPGTAMPAQYIALINNWASKGEFKTEELQWSGLPEWLREQPGKLTKEQVLDYLGANELEVKEVVMGDEALPSKEGLAARQKVFDKWAERINAVHEKINRSWSVENEQDRSALLQEESRLLAERDAEADAVYKIPVSVDTKFPKYTLPGGRDYRELLLTLPIRPPHGEIINDGKDSKYPFAIIVNGKEYNRTTTRDAAEEVLQEAIEKKWNAGAYRSPHFLEQNVLSHVRFNERTDTDGKRVLFLEEVQSDWHQAGRKQGYQGEDEAKRKEFVDFLKSKGIEQPSGGISIRMLEDAGAPEDMVARFDAYMKGIKGIPVPDAPFKKTWPELVMKRMLRYAAENGYDRLAWTTGEQQAERYDLSKQIDKIEYAKPEHGDNGAHLLVTKNGQSVFDKEVRPSELPNLIGKELASKVMATEPEENGYVSLAGLDLKVGGEGMKGFYDRIIPAFLNKYAKKWGAQVGKTEIPARRGPNPWKVIDENGDTVALFANEASAKSYADEKGGRIKEALKAVPVHSIDITPAMKYSVLSEGQALFEDLKSYHPEYRNDETNLKLAEAALKATREYELSLGGRENIDKGGREVRGGTRTLGVGISAELARKGYIDFRGRSVQNAHEVAVLAQVYRNPQYETIRYIYAKNGVVVGHEGRTSRLPGSAIAFVEQPKRELFKIRNRMSRLGANEFWLVHNHPSGNPTPSVQDRRFTAFIRQSIPGFKGHVIINSGKYASLLPGHETGALEEALSELRTDDRILQPYKDHPLLGTYMGGKETLADIAKALKTSKDFITVVYRGSDGTVRAIQEIPVGMANNARGLTNYLRGRARTFGAPSVFLAVNEGNSITPAQKEVLTELTSKGVVRDTLFENTSVMEQAETIKGNSSEWMGAPVKGMRVAEGSQEEGLIKKLQRGAVPFVKKDLTMENWNKEFGERQTVETPIGEVKLGKNQYIKLKANKREDYFGLIKPTLQEPLFIVKDKREGTVFIKTFLNEDRIRYFVSVSYNIEGLKIVVTNHLETEERIVKTIMNGKLLYTTDAAIRAAVPASPKQPTVANGLHDGTSTADSSAVSKKNISPSVDEVNKVKEEEAPYETGETKAEGPKIDRQIVKSPLNPFKRLEDFFHPLGIKNPDLKRIEALYSLPWWMSKKHPEYKEALDVELAREERREQLLHDFLKKTAPPAEGEKDVHEYLALPKGQAEELFKVMVESDKDNATYLAPGAERSGDTPYLQDVAKDVLGKELNEAQVKAYYAWKDSMDKVFDLILKEAERLTYLPYADKLWKDKLIAVVNEEMTLEQAEGELSLADFKELKAAVEKINPFKKTLKKIRRQMGYVKYYVPRVRNEGDYVVRAHDSRSNTIWHERATSERGAAEIKKKLEEKFPGKKISVTIEPATPESLYQAVSDAAIERFIEESLQKFKKRVRIGQSSVFELRDAMIETIGLHLKERGFGRHMIGRIKGTAIGGYQTENGQKIFSDYLSGMAGFISKQEAAYKFSRVLENISLDKPILFEEVSNYVKDMLRNTTNLDQLSGKARALAYAYFLAGNIKSAAVQMTQNFVTGIPFLARETKGATAKYTKAMYDVARGNLKEEEARALHEAIDKGIASSQYINEVTGKLKSQLEGVWQKVMDVLSIPFSGAETFNRKSAFLAMFRAQRAKGQPYEAAFSKARDYVYDVHYLMGKANLPGWARGGTAYHAGLRTAYTFRSFNHNYLLSMAEAIKRQPDGDRNLGVIGRSLAWLMVFGGLTAVPFLDDTMDELEKLTGVPFRSQIRRLFRGFGGEILEKVGVKGIPALLGVDLSGSIKVGLPALGSPSENIYGVYGGIAQKGQNAYGAFSSGQVLRGIESLSPAFVENPLKAYRMHTKGATNQRGKPLFDEHGKPVYTTLPEAGLQGLGFNPERISGIRQEHRVMENVKDYFKSKREDLITEFRVAKTQKERQAIMKDIQAYNRSTIKYNGAIPRITRETLHNAVAQKPDKGFIRFEAGMDSGIDSGD